MILIAARHVTPATCTPRGKQTRFSTKIDDKDRTMKNSWIQIQTNANQLLITHNPREE
jgi:hypothetical protein